MQYIFNTYYTVLRTVNHFSKIKKAFSVKLKMISVDHHFRLYQTLKNKKLYIYISENILHSNKLSLDLF
jgi:hypothetical protein